VRRLCATAASCSRKLAGTPKEALGSLLHDPRLATDLPLRVTSYTAQGVDFDRVKTLIVAELDSPGSSEAVWGFEVHDGPRVISDAFDKVTLKTLAGEPVVTSASLPPGKYTLRFGMVDDQGRRASVDRPLTLGLHLATAGDLEFSDVFAGVAAGGHFNRASPSTLAPARSSRCSSLRRVERGSKTSPSSSRCTARTRLGEPRRARTGAGRAASSGGRRASSQGAAARSRAGPGRYTVTAMALLVNGKPAGSEAGTEVGPAVDAHAR
jgi:hypothetical protein